MDIVVKKLPASQVEMHVTLGWDEWKKECDHAAEHVAKEVKMPGFRPGKVPRTIIEKRYGKEVIVQGIEGKAAAVATVAKGLKMYQEKFGK